MAVMRLFALLPMLLLLPLAAPAAKTVQAQYEVFAGGMLVLQLEARFTTDDAAYRIETRFRTRGLAATFLSGEQVAEASGVWRGAIAMPARYRSEGVWRGTARRVAMEWRGAEPRVLDLTPPNEAEREAVPDALRRDTVDALTALLALGRAVERSGACEVSAPVFDGRRRSDYVARTETRDMIRPWRGGWSGEALRCTFEGRQVAGFRSDQDRAEAAAPQRGTAWMAAPFAGAVPIPVRIDIPTRWFGTATAVLLSAQEAR